MKYTTKTTICTLALSLAIGSAGVISAGVISIGTACSGANSYYSSSSEDRPDKPEFILHKPYVLEINTNGYDINLESYLRPDRTTVVEFGAWWCSPCTAFKHGALQIWPSDLDLILVDLEFRLPDDESIQSPAGRYVDKNGGKTIPYIIIYHGKEQRNAFPFSGMGYDKLFEEARKL